MPIDLGHRAVGLCELEDEAAIREGRREEGGGEGESATERGNGGTEGGGDGDGEEKVATTIWGEGVGETRSAWRFGVDGASPEEPRTIYRVLLQPVF